MRPRISLRGLLILTALLAAFCYWRNRPRQIASQFVAAIEAGDYAFADTLVVDDDGTFSMRECAGPAGEFWIVRVPQTSTDWLNGQCRITFVGKGSAFGVDGTVAATASGIRKLKISRSDYGGINPLKN
jgi:hypothetical protein